jgi:S-adenosylmethionine hydrolase
MPAGVHLAVVDPGVGSQRRAVALRLADDRFLVGPDNGLLDPAAQRFGGVVEAVDVSHSPFRLEPVSATFHGRDIFAPVAAHLATGEPLAAAGEPVDPDSLISLALPSSRREGDAVVAHALAVDRFGNVALDVGHDELTAAALQLGHRLELQIGEERYFAQYARAFVDVAAGEILVYEDAYRMLAVAINRGDAAETLQLAVDSELTIRPA